MLTSKQRQFLKGLAHPLSPVVRVGKGRLTASVIEETRKSLAAHELIKVRIEGPDRQALAEDLAQKADAEVAALIGKVAILYRPREEKPKIKLP
jgi:RNA-binding protein